MRNLVRLNNEDTDVQVATAPPAGITDLDAKLTVPATQSPGAYSGNVILTFVLIDPFPCSILSSKSNFNSA